MKLIRIQTDPAPASFVGALRLAGVELVPCPATSSLLPEGDAYLLGGDVPACDLDDWLVKAIVRRVEAGAGLLVAGGPHGFGRGGHAGPLADLLPVELENGCDREHVASGLFLRRRFPHPITDGLPWEQPPVITGFHRVTERAGSRTLLEGARILSIGITSASLAARTLPILVARDHGEGRVVALMTDLTGPWSSGLQCWGTPSIPVAGEELGGAYCRLLMRLTGYLAGRETSALTPWSATRAGQKDRPRTFVGLPATSLLGTAVS